MKPTILDIHFVSIFCFLVNLSVFSTCTSCPWHTRTFSVFHMQAGTYYLLILPNQNTPLIQNFFNLKYASGTEFLCLKEMIFESSEIRKKNANFFLYFINEIDFSFQVPVFYFFIKFWWEPILLNYRGEIIQLCLIVIRSEKSFL